MFWNKKQNQSNEKVAITLMGPAEYVEELVDLVSAISGVEYILVDDDEIVLEINKDRIDGWLGKARRFGRFA